MSDIAPLGGPSPASYDFSSRVERSVAQSSNPERGSDRVELSGTAKLLGKLAEGLDVRQDLIAKVRAEIADGTYETPEKLDAAVEGLSEDLV